MGIILAIVNILARAIHRCLRCRYTPNMSATIKKTMNSSKATHKRYHAWCTGFKEKVSLFQKRYPLKSPLYVLTKELKASVNFAITAACTAETDYMLL